MSATKLDVGQGGTGVTTLAAHGVVIGNGSSAVNVTGAGTSGQVLTSNGASADPTWQTSSGSGSVTSITAGTGLTGGTITTSGTIALDLTQANTWTGVISETQNLAANTSGDGLVLQNTTAATSGNQRWSPNLRLTGYYYSGGSKEVDYTVANQPDGTGPNLIFAHQINGGGYTHDVTFSAGIGSVNLTSGWTYQIGGSTVLSATTLGFGVTNSNLTSLGILSDLNITNNSFIGATKGFGAEHLKIANGVSSSSGTPVENSPALMFEGQAWNSSASSSELDGFYAQCRPVSQAGPTTANFVLSSYINVHNSTPTDVLTVSNVGTVTFAGGEIGGQSTATVTSNATTLANDFRSYIIPSNSGTAVAVTGPSAVAGQIISIINKDTTAATTGIVVPANSCRTFIYDGTKWWAST